MLIPYPNTELKGSQRSVTVHLNQFDWINHQNQNDLSLPRNPVQFEGNYPVQEWRYECSLRAVGGR